MSEFVYEIAPVLAGLAAIAAAVLTFIFIVPDKKRAKLNKFGKFLHDLCNFKFLIIEKILQFCYVLATAFTLIYGFFMLFAVEEHYSYSYYGGSYRSTEWVGYYGLLMMILGPIFVRISYEIFMLALIAVKNIIQINNKIKNQNDDATNADPFAAPDVSEYIAPRAAAPVAPAANSFCQYCGTPKNADEFCSNCGQK